MQHSDPLKDIFPSLTHDDVRLMGSELTQLRAMVGRGEAVVMNGAPVAAWWGLCIALGSLWTAFENFGLLPVVAVAPLELLAGGIGMLILKRWLKLEKVLKFWRNEAISTAWFVGVISIPIFAVGTIFRKVIDLFLMSGYECIIFALVTAVSATASHNRWLLFPAGGWMLTAVAILFVADEHWRPFLFSFGCLAFMTAPCVYLYLADKKA